MRVLVPLLFVWPLPALAVGGPNVAILHADPSNVAEIHTALTATGAFSSVTLFNANTASPNAAYLASFDAVLVYLNSSFQSPYTTGEALVDYLALGGGVVMANPPFMGGPAYSLPGRIVDHLPMYQLAGGMV